MPEIFDAVFECTLDMINKDFEEFPEHRTEFFTLLQAVNSHCFAGQWSFISIIKYRMVLFVLVWAAMWHFCCQYLQKATKCALFYPHGQELFVVHVNIAVSTVGNWTYMTCSFSYSLVTRCDFILLAFLEIPPPQFKLVLDSVIWAFKHTMRNISEIGLDILNTMLKNISQFDQAAQNFYSLYFTDILQHVFSVVADSVHTGGRQGGRVPV